MKTFIHLIRNIKLHFLKNIIETFFKNINNIKNTILIVEVFKLTNCIYPFSKSTGFTLPRNDFYSNFHMEKGLHISFSYSLSHNVNIPEYYKKLPYLALNRRTYDNIKNP